MGPRRIGLVACAATKRDHPDVARDLYVGSHFIKSLSLSEKVDDQTFILSAKHGLVTPEQYLKPYDATLKRMSPAQRSAWGVDVAVDLRARFGHLPVRLVFYAGVNYIQPILKAIDAFNGQAVACNRKPWDALHEAPMKGLGIGQRLHWLNVEIEQQRQRANTSFLDFLASGAPRRAAIEDLTEALDEAATSLETASKWGIRKDLTEGLEALHPWAANRAEVARRALKSMERVADPEPVNPKLLGLLKTTLGNLNDLRACHFKVLAYDTWIDAVERAIALVEPKS